MEIRNRILREVGELFTQKGIRNVTMDDISNHLGMSKRTIYEVFEDKNDLVKQIIEEGVKLHKSECKKIITESTSVIEAIFNIGRLNHRTFSKIHPLFFEDLKKYHHNVYSKITKDGDMRDEKVTLLLLERGQKEGMFKEHINIEAANTFVHKIMEMVHQHDFGIYDTQTLINSVFMPYLIGISTDKGRDLIEKELNTLKNARI